MFLLPVSSSHTNLRFRFMSQRLYSSIMLYSYYQTCQLKGFYPLRWSGCCSGLTVCSPCALSLSFCPAIMYNLSPHHLDEKCVNICKIEKREVIL